MHGLMAPSGTTAELKDFGQEKHTGRENKVKAINTKTKDNHTHPTMTQVRAFSLAFSSSPIML